MIVILEFAGLELLRLLRRRETFWSFAGLALVVAAGALVLIFPDMHVQDPPHVLHAVRNYAALGEAAALAFLAYALAFASVDRDRKRGMLALLGQTPVGPAAVYSGKLLGLAALLAALHGFAGLLLVGFAPIVGEPFWRTVSWLVLGWSIAVGYLPEGFVLASVHVAKGRAYVLFRLLSLARAGVTLAALQMLILPAARGNGVDIFEIARLGLDNLMGTTLVPAAAYFPSPWLPILVPLAWHLASGAALFAWLLARPPR